MEAFPLVTIKRNGVITVPFVLSEFCQYMV